MRTRRTLVLPWIAAVSLIGVNALLADTLPSSEAPSEPPAPSASPAVQTVLDQVTKRVEAKDLEGALHAADEAVEQARVANCAFRPI